MSAQNSAGIQTLLDAERDAQKIVQKARAYRTAKVKEARSSAAAEIEAYKAQKEAEFKKFEEQHSGIYAQVEAEAAKEVEKTLKEIEELGKQKAPQVVDDLVKAVTDVKPVQHRNATAATTA